MKEIYELRYMDYTNNESKHISAYSDKKTAIYRVKKLNAQYGRENPFYMNKKVIK